MNKNEISINGSRWSETEILERFQDQRLLQSALAELLSCVESGQNVNAATERAKLVLAVTKGQAPRHQLNQAV